MIGIYSITNLVSGNVYYGSSFDIEKRIAKHKSRLLNNKHENKHLQRSYNNRKSDTFVFSILEICNSSITDAELRKLEQEYIDKTDKDKLYNQCLVAGSTKGKKHSIETREKISKALKGHKKLCNRAISEETRKKLSKAHKGIPRPKRVGIPYKNKGKPNVNGRKTILQIDKITNVVIKEWIGLREAAQGTGTQCSDICKVCKGKGNTANGYIWKYKNIG